MIAIVLTTLWVLFILAVFHVTWPWYIITLVVAGALLCIYIFDDSF
jgi:hypothetical protein